MPSPSLIGFEHRVVVGVGEMAVSNNPNVVLSTYSLGSCLGVAIYDPVTRVGGLLHAMLPDSGIHPAKASVHPAMFIDTGIPALFRAAYELKADKHRIRVIVAGGAQILDSQGFFNIGKRNIDALTTLLASHRLQITAQQIGGLVNRTLYLNVNTGVINLKVSGQTGEVLLWKP